MTRRSSIWPVDCGPAPSCNSCCENRLRLVDLWARQPAIADESIRSPIVVTGLGRSGTTLLHELLACDPDNRPPKLWELVDSVPPPTPAESLDPNTPRADGRTTRSR